MLAHSIQADLGPLNHRHARLYDLFKTRITWTRSEPFVTALVFSFFALGLSLARFGVLAALIATALSTLIVRLWLDQWLNAYTGFLVEHGFSGRACRSAISSVKLPH